VWSVEFGRCRFRNLSCRTGPKLVSTFSWSTWTTTIAAGQLPLIFCPRSFISTAVTSHSPGRYSPSSSSRHAGRFLSSLTNKQNSPVVSLEWVSCPTSVLSILLNEGLYRRYLCFPAINIILHPAAILTPSLLFYFDHDIVSQKFVHLIRILGFHVKFAGTVTWRSSCQVFQMHTFSRFRITLPIERGVRPPFHLITAAYIC
jgi:hypothetical protein